MDKKPDRRKFLQIAGLGAAGAAAVGVGATLEGCSSTPNPIEPVETSADPKLASEQTILTNGNLQTLLDFGDTTEMENARRGFIDAPGTLVITNEEGEVVWSQKDFDFLGSIDDPAATPDTANPSLWRNAQHNHMFGLFEVVDGIYQVRGYDMANITFVASNAGWIVLDPLTSVECAKAALDLINTNLGQRPIKAVIISHSHVDHFGGIKGIVSEEDVSSGKVPIIAPSGFDAYVASENLLTGNAVGRRAGYPFGTMLEKSEQGALSVGIGLGLSSGTVSYIAPTDYVYYTGEQREIDGVIMEFQLTPNTEAPAEMNTWFPQKKALWGAENCSATLHNLYNLRGSQVGDGSAWAKYLMEAITRYGEDVEVLFVAHNWPHWDNDVVRQYLLDQAAMYKFINDQTLNLANQGYTASEIALMIQLPDDLAKIWYLRQYYGTLAHNARAVYQRHIGWYDANPVNLNPLPPSDQAARFVEYLGDVNAVMQLAKRDFDAGDYQWVAQITNILVFADPSNTAARNLCADALEQLAYQAESGTWRNAYLSGALELRLGTNPNDSADIPPISDLEKNLTPDIAFDYMNIMLNNNAVQDLNATINIFFTDGDPWLLVIRSGVILYQKGVSSDDASLTIKLPTSKVLYLMEPNAYRRSEVMKAEGDTALLEKIIQNLSEYNFFFNIVEP